jgi:hypothetical protein
MLIREGDRLGGGRFGLSELPEEESQHRGNMLRVGQLERAPDLGGADYRGVDSFAGSIRASQ